ncbi:MAG: hemin ABC transporter substrate-binding protein [Chloroflexaceae bacterium]
MMSLLNAGKWIGLVFIVALSFSFMHNASTTRYVVHAQEPEDTTTVFLPLVFSSNPFQQAPELPTTVTDLNGEVVTIRSTERIIGLNGDITEIIFALGMGDNVVAADISATYPPAAVELPKIGYQRGLDAEAIINFAPTVVLGQESAGPAAVLVQLREAGLTLALTDDPPDLTAPAKKIRFVAQALGVPQRGEVLVEQLEADLATVDAALAGVSGPKPRVIFLYLRQGDEGNVRLVFGDNTPTNAMIERAGGIDAAADIGIEGFFQPITAEALIAAQPDIILVFTSGLAEIGGEDALLALPGIAQTPAGQARRILAMDGEYLAAMTPRTGKALLDMVEFFYP